MNTLIYTGRLASAPEARQHGDTTVAKLTLIRNEYAGKDGKGQARERVVSVQFTAFNGVAEALAKHARKGDQLIVDAGLENNNYEKDDVKHYGYNFVIRSFEFGAPGPEKRAELEAGGK